MTSRAIPFSLLLAAVAFAPLAIGIASLPTFETTPLPGPGETEPGVPRDSAGALIAEIREEAGLFRASGIEARRINAAMPVTAGTVETAQALDLSMAPSPDRQLALKCLTQAVYYEAGFEPVEGRRAVAQVVLNRMRHPAFPKSVCGVVYDGSTRPGCQFSFTCDGSLRRAPSPKAWRRAEEIASAALAGDVETSVGYATHYHTDWVAPYWAPRLAKITQIGAHIFYRWPGSWGRKGAFTGTYAGGEKLGAMPNVPVQMAAAVSPAMVAQAERRAENDVGGRLDATKGWTLSIPVPGETGGSLSRTVATQTTSAAPTALALNENPGSAR